ncbi:hypothetical protein [Reichenbachiella sp. MALMAid0571]|uniref:hypothetical protein n=1 Tax=Reichenbachiella sp. MALMAid0571 TaxID=3143939 RepID=UPI0032DE51B1
MKGIRVKRPLLVFVFGLILISISLYVILITSGFLEVILTTNFEGDSFSAYKTFSYFLLMGGFLIAIGGVAIFQATYPIWIMRAEFTDGTHHVFGLQKLFEVNEVFTFIRFLRENFTLIKLEIDDRIA